jgi:hypothetical protein
MHWWARLMEDSEYARRFILRWKSLRESWFRTENIMHFIDSITLYLGNEIEKNYQRWPIIGKYVWPNYFIGKSYDEEISYLKEWITNRLLWMDMATDINSGLFNEAFDTEIITYPNPVLDKMKLIFSVRSILPVMLDIFDISGRENIKEIIYPSKAGIQETEKDFSGLKTGIYFLLLKQNNRVVGRKIFIKN